MQQLWKAPKVTPMDPLLGLDDLYPLLSAWYTFISSWLLHVPPFETVSAECSTSEPKKHLRRLFIISKACWWENVGGKGTRHLCPYTLSSPAGLINVSHILSHSHCWIKSLDFSHNFDLRLFRTPTLAFKRGTQSSFTSIIQINSYPYGFFW